MFYNITWKEGGMMYDTIRLISEYIKDREYSKIRTLLSDVEAYDLAVILEGLTPEALVVVFRLLPKELAAEAFAEMDTESRITLIDSFSDSELRYVIEELYYDDAVDMIEEMPANVVKRILSNATVETRNSINALLRYSSDSAGGVMTTEYVRFNENITVAEAIRQIREVGIDKETIYNCYVTKKDRTLVGVVSAKDLLLSSPDVIIGDIMMTSVISAKTSDDKGSVARAMQNYDFIAMPIVDNESRLVGIVTYDDAMDVITEESDEDIQIMAAITPTETSYLDQSIFSIWKARFPWLLILMISATFTSIIISSFEKKLSALVILTAYIPMLMGTGGNCGSQASVTIIRGLSLGDIHFIDVFRVMWKEFRVSLMCAITLSVVNFIKLYLFDILIIKTPGLTVTVAAVICLTLAVVVICAKFIGCSLPILAKRIGLDPAVTASPFITTCIDAVALLVYFGFATWMLNI